jgi:hypothetical protein
VISIRRCVGSESWTLEPDRSTGQEKQGSATASQPGAWSVRAGKYPGNIVLTESTYLVSRSSDFVRLQRAVRNVVFFVEETFKVRLTA